MTSLSVQGIFKKMYNSIFVLNIKNLVSHSHEQVFVRHDFTMYEIADSVHQNKYRSFIINVSQVMFSQHMCPKWNARYPDGCSHWHMMDVRVCSSMQHIFDVMTRMLIMLYEPSHHAKPDYDQPGCCGPLLVCNSHRLTYITYHCSLTKMLILSLDWAQWVNHKLVASMTLC